MSIRHTIVQYLTRINTNVFSTAAAAATMPVIKQGKTSNKK